MACVTKEWLCQLQDYGKDPTESKLQLAWLREHIHDDIGWVLDIRTDWINDKTAKVHVQCEGDVYLGFQYHLDTMKCGKIKYSL